MVKLKTPIMKKLFLLIMTAFALTISGCAKKYTLSTDFGEPTTLSSPERVILDVASNNNIVLSWSGGGALDGSYALYEVLFHRKGENTTEPIERIKSDQGAEQKLTLTHATLNAIARKAGIKPGEKGELSWTVVTSKGGERLTTDLKKDIEVTRGEGIDNMPNSLYLFGAGNENNGAEGSLFRKAADGIYVIYSQVIGSGELEFKGKVGEEEYSYFLDNDKLKEGVGTMTVAPNTNPYRITVDFNTLSIKTELITNVRAIWGATYDVIGQLAYMGAGKFVANNSVIRFIDPSKPETNPPGWLGWIEERYYFIAEVDNVEKCWGRMDGVSSERPVGGEPLSFYELGEFTWSQWDHLWKMKGSLDSKRATITIHTNKDNLMVHEFSNITNL